MENRVYNFNPGPSTLPLEVLQTAQKELLDYEVQACRLWKYLTVPPSTMKLIIRQFPW